MWQRFGAAIVTQSVQCWIFNQNAWREIRDEESRGRSTMKCTKVRREECLKMKYGEFS